MSQVQDVQTVVVEKIKKSTPEVFDQVVEILAQEEIKERTKLVVDAFKKITTIEDEIKKVRPDQSSYNQEGEVISESYSKIAFENLKKLNDKKIKLTTAIENAFKSLDYSMLKNYDKQNQ
jgi:aconitase A